MEVSEREFDYIHSLYMHTGMDKDEFCEHYITSGDGRILREVHARAVSEGVLHREAKNMLDYVATLLIGKAHAYDDTDLYNEAVRIIGQSEVTRKTLEEGLPLWEEDTKFLKELLTQKR